MGGSHVGGKPLIGARGKDITFIMDTVLHPPKKPARFTMRILAAAVAVLVVAPMVWLATGHLTISQLSLNRVQVRLDFAALIDWSSGMALSEEASCSQVPAHMCLFTVDYWYAILSQLQCGSHAMLCPLQRSCAWCAGAGNTDHSADVPYNRAHPP